MSTEKLTTMNDMKFAYVSAHPLFANLGEQKIKDACSSIRIKTIARGELIQFGEGDFSKLYLLISGRVKITSIDNAGDEMIKDIITAPDVFGNLSLGFYNDADEHAEALTNNTIVCYFNVIDFKSLLQQHPLVAISYANIVNNKLRKLEKRHTDLVSCDAKHRLIRFISRWARTEGNRIGDKIVLNNYLTHSDIAGVIATSRQSVNVLLNELRDAGLLFYNRRKIELTNSPVWN